MTPKILIIDIETTPILSYHWGLHDQHIGISQVVERSRLLCFAAKYVGEKKILFHSEWGDGQRPMVQAAHNLLSEADVVLGFNSDSFDIKRLNDSFDKENLGPPEPYLKIDIFKESKKHFRYMSHKLENVLIEMSLENKIKHRGFSLWPACMSGDKKAQAEMKRYNIGDIVPLEDAYLRIRPWMQTHPNLNLWEFGDNCPNCGSEDLKPRGFRTTRTAVYQRFRCGGCGSWPSNGTRLAGASVR